MIRVYLGKYDIIVLKRIIIMFYYIIYVNMFVIFI